MKKYLIGLFFLILAVGVLMYRDTLKTLAASYFTETKNATSTTTPVFVQAADATTTLTSSFGDADSGYLYMQVAASTTQTGYQWSYEFSADGQDYFGEDLALNPLASSTVPHASSTIIHTWTPGKTATTSRMFKIPDGVGKFVRVNYRSINANGTIWLNIIPKRLRF